MTTERESIVTQVSNPEAGEVARRGAEHGFRKWSRVAVTVTQMTDGKDGESSGSTLSAFPAGTDLTLGQLANIIDSLRAEHGDDWLVA